VEQAVESGEVVVILEAMKMETEIRADRSGTIVSIAVREGDSAQAGDALLHIG
jgi:oxaloacetate decarboxylase alpha subunit